MTFGVTEIVVSPGVVSATGPGIASVEPQALSLLDADQWHQAFGTTSSTLSGVKVNHKSVIGYPAMWRGINLLANSVGGMPLDIYRNPAREIDRNHPAQKLMKRMASPIVTACNFRKTMMSHMLLFGNGFAWIERDSANNPIELWPLDPQSVIVRFYEGELWYSTYIDGEQMTFPGRNVVHFKGLSHNSITGYSAVDIFHEHLGIGLAAAQFGARFFGDGANMSGILQVPGHFSDEKIRNSLSAWRDMSQGMSNSHKVALLQDGVKFQSLTVPPDSAQFLQTREFEVRATVGNILGLPGHLLGDNSKSSFNSLEQENQSYLFHSLAPHLKEFEGEFTSKLMTEQQQTTESHYIEFNRESAVQMLMSDKIDAIYRQMEVGILTVNEGRALLNLTTIGTDGDVRYRPANWLPVDEETDEDSDADQGSVAAEPAEVDQESRVAGIIQKIYSGIGTVLTADEARQLVTEAGFDLPDGFEPDAPAPAFGQPAEEPAEDEEDEADDEPEENPFANLHLSTRGLILSAVEQSIATEQTHIVTAAKRAKNFKQFTSRVDKFYSAWSAKLLPSLGEAAESIKAKYIDERCTQIIETAAVSTDQSLVSDMETLVADWHDKADSLASQLMGTL